MAFGLLHRVFEGSGLWKNFVDACPLLYHSPNALSKEKILDTILFSVLSGQRRYAHSQASESGSAGASTAGMRVGVVLAAVGLHGVQSFLVSRRTSEIGLRMALGATSRNVYKLILGQAMRWTISGVLIGLAASYPAYQFARTLLFSVDAMDPQSVLVAVALLLAVALFAAWLPSYRATRIEAMRALRHN